MIVKITQTCTTARFHLDFSTLFFLFEHEKDKMKINSLTSWHFFPFLFLIFLCIFSRSGVFVSAVETLCLIFTVWNCSSSFSLLKPQEAGKALATAGSQSLQTFSQHRWLTVCPVKPNHQHQQCWGQVTFTFTHLWCNLSFSTSVFFCW